MSNYPADVDNSHPHFHEPHCPEVCPDCGDVAGDEVYCQRCGTVLDPDEAAAIEREQHEDRLYDEARDRGEA